MVGFEVELRHGDMIADLGDESKGIWDGGDKGKNSVSLPLYVVDSLLLYVCPCGGEFVGRGNVESPFQSILHDALNLTLAQNDV